jgi:hypothetical protein
MTEIVVGKIHGNKGKGSYEIIEYHNRKKVKIRFIDSGFEKYVESKQIERYCIIDPYYPSNFGIGYLGEGEFNSRDTPAYDFWRSILKKVVMGDHITLEGKWYKDNYSGEDFITSTNKEKYGPSTCMFADYNKHPRVGDILESNNYGDYRVLASGKGSKVCIEFLKTGYKLTTTLNVAVTGNVKDPYYPSIRGVGYLGVGKEKTQVAGKMTKAYQSWIDMLKRCYDPYFLNKNKTYRNCFVCKEWFNFQVFAKWHNNNYVDGYDLDKDIKQRGVEFKVYSPSTCEHVPKSVNIEEANAKHYLFLSPDGELVPIYNMRKFCKLHGLDAGRMGAVYRGKTEHYKDWRVVNKWQEEVK